jgi:hypothetical protein
MKQNDAIRATGIKIRNDATCPMRTTLTLDEDVYDLAHQYARGTGVSLGAAVCEFVRQGQRDREAQHAKSAAPATTLVPGPHGLMTLAPNRRVLTSEMVRAALKEDD